MKWLDDRVNEWKRSQGNGPLHEYLGMSEKLCADLMVRPRPYVLGIDEVGYGPLAGPLVVGGVVAPADWTHPALKDSKKFHGSDGKAERLRADALKQLSADETALFFICRVSNEEIDQMGVFAALMLAFEEVVVTTYAAFDRDTLIVLDGNNRIRDLEHVALPEADSFVPHVSAASIVAKVYRDTEMRGYDKQYPEYGFGAHKGYGSAAHQEAIRKHGLCPIHRRSYKMKFLENGSTSSSP